MDHAALSRELVRALRDKRSQPWLSRRVGLKSNLVYRWEAGRAWPSAPQFFRICRAVGQSAAPGLVSFLGAEHQLELESAAGVAELLRLCAGRRPVIELARAMKRSRFIVSRWLSGKTDIKLPDFLRFVEATTLRLLDLVALVTDPAALPSAARAWKRLQVARQAAYEVPWSHAVLRALELQEYKTCSEPHEVWLAARLGIPIGEVRRCMSLLMQSGQIRRRGTHFELRSSATVDTRFDRERRRALRAFWSGVASERLARGDPGINAYNLFAIAERDLPQVLELHREMFERLRALVAGSEPSERVVLYSAQIVELDRSVP
jgi:transcriptional regulator with XRE-family HTH domain